MAFHNVPPNGFPDLPDVEELEAVVKDVTGLKAELDTVKSGLNNLGTYTNCPDVMQLETGVTIVGKTLYTNDKVMYGTILLDLSQVSQISVTTIGHMVSGYRPISHWIAIAMSYETLSDAGTASFVTFATNGDITVEHTASKPYLLFSFAYPIAN